MTPPRTQAIRLDMTMSLDGFVVGPQDSVDAPIGSGCSTGWTAASTQDRTVRCSRRERDPCRDRGPAAPMSTPTDCTATTTTASRSSC
jgi:hypothetical protein